MLGLLALNDLRPVDVTFFIVIGALVALCIAIYFLIPVINRKQYKEMRDNLKRREVAFNAGKQNAETTDVTAEAEQEPEKKE